MINSGKTKDYSQEAEMEAERISWETRRSLERVVTKEVNGDLKEELVSPK